MGIKQLFSIIKDEAPDAIKEGEIKNHFGRKVAIVRQPFFRSPLIAC
jgi:flap endonuclease-1